MKKCIVILALIGLVPMVGCSDPKTGAGESARSATHKEDPKGAPDKGGRTAPKD